MQDDDPYFHTVYDTRIAHSCWARITWGGGLPEQRHRRAQRSISTTRAKVMVAISFIPILATWEYADSPLSEDFAARHPRRRQRRDLHDA
jgi:hypothetical protein